MIGDQISVSCTGQYNPAEALQETFQTDADFHENNPVSCLAFAAALPGLAGGGVSNSGWLVSASINMLNLWECGRGQDSSALQVAHVESWKAKTWHNSWNACKLPNHVQRHV